MIQCIRNEYCGEIGEGDDRYHGIKDVSYAIERAEAHAKPPLERAHARAASMRRSISMLQTKRVT